MKTFISSLIVSLLVGGALTSEADELQLLPLVPDHVGLTFHQKGFTLQKSPTIYVDVRDIVDQTDIFSIRFTLIDSRSMRPVAEFPLNFQTYPGLQRVQLGAYGIELQPEVPYEWYVTEIFNPDPSKTFEVTRGSIVRIDPKHRSYPGGPCGTDMMWKLIDAKIWYDAFACVNELIEAYPDDLTLHDLRAELLGKCRHPYDRMPTMLAPCLRNWW